MFSQTQPQPQPPKKSHTFRNVVLGILVGGFLLLGGCVALVAIGANGIDSEVKAGTAQSSDPTTEPTTEDTAPAAVDETTPPPVDPGVAKVGVSQWFTYEDGLKVQVTKVSRFTIGRYSAGGKPGDKGVEVTVTIKNGTGEVFDSELATVELASGPNGDQAESVFDGDRGLSGGFTGSIPVGKSKTAKYGFAIPKGHKAVEIEVAPSWEHNGSHFEGTVK